MIESATAPAQSAGSAMAPLPHRVRARVQENHDTATLELTPVGTAIARPRPGQFMMLYAFGVGEVAVSVSRCLPQDDGSIAHTIRRVGAVSRALHDAVPGSIIGVRGPFGTPWGVEDLIGRDLVLVAGGVGLAPLHPVMTAVLADRAGYGRVTLIVGARSQSELLFADELAEWAGSPSVEVHLTVDVPVQGWAGEAGLVTEPLHRLTLDPDHTAALLCGPESMMVRSAQVLMEKGLAASDIRVCLERNMQCGVGWCGHCQLGPLLLCRDGPVVGYDTAGPLVRVRQL